jgi:hypothetical protein
MEPLFVKLLLDSKGQWEFFVLGYDYPIVTRFHKGK